MMSNNSFLQQISLNTKEDKLSPKELLFKFITYLPFFLVSIAVCISVAFSILRYKVPIYKSSTRILIKNNSDNKPSFSNGGGNDLIESALFSNNQTNLDNEIMAIKSSRFIQKIVTDYHFNHYYYKEGSFKNTELYGNLPFEFIPLKWGDSLSEFKLYITNLTVTGGTISTSKKAKDKMHFNWNTIISFSGNQFKLVPQFVDNSNSNYFFAYEPSIIATNRILANLMVYPNNSKTTVIQLDLKGENLLKISTILNSIVEKYAVQALAYKNLIVNNTVDFINKRLEIVTVELAEIEDELTSFKTSNNLVDESSLAEEIYSKKATIEESLNQIIFQDQSIQILIEKVKAVNSTQLLPTDFSFSNSVSALITQYNSLVLKKLKEEPNIGKNSLVLKDLNLQIIIARNVILEEIDAVLKMREIQKKTLRKRSLDQQNIYAQIPLKEQRLVNIKRQQNVKEGLFLYLLQKREETAITSTANIDNYEQIELANGYQIEPVSKNLYTYAILLGFLIPIGYIFLKDFFNDKILGRHDIIQQTKVPIIADIGHIKDFDSSLIVNDNGRNLIAEQFRTLRTNLSFLNQGKTTTLVTSSMSGEGKSFISFNLAAALALSSKKVALLEFDLRKPAIIKNIKVQKKKVGLSNYLASQTDSLDDLYYAIEKFPTFHVYGSGPIPPNPSELMNGDRVKQLFEKLKESYDFIIIDTAPVGLVSDAFNIMSFVDNTIYVLRQRKSLKKQVKFIDECFQNNKFSNVGIVLNDVKVGPKHGYYGYNYTYGYSYSYNQNSYGGYFDIKNQPNLIKRLMQKLQNRN